LPFFLKVFISKEICTECLKKSNEIVRTASLNDSVRIERGPRWHNG